MSPTMTISLIQSQLRYKLDEAEEVLSLYVFMGWDTEWPIFWRHILIEALQEIQLKEWEYD